MPQQVSSENSQQTKTITKLPSNIGLGHAKVFQTNCMWTKIATSHKNSHYSQLVFSKKFYPAQLKIFYGNITISKLVIGKVKTCIVEFVDSEILNISTYPQYFAVKATIYFSSSFPKLKVYFPYLFQQKIEGLQIKYNCRYKYLKRVVNVHAGIWIENYGTKKYLINYYVKLTFKSHSI